MPSLKQSWIASEVGVDRKTVVRWINGQVKQIVVENAQRLSGVLQCSIEDLCGASADSLFATLEDQTQAAQLLQNSRALIERLGPTGEWALIESLLKAIVVPNLPLATLGELYAQLTVATWRQSKLEQAEIYNQKTLTIAERLQNSSLKARALMDEALLQNWRGEIPKSLDTYQKILKLDEFLTDRQRGAVRSNIGAVECSRRSHCVCQP